MTCFNPLLNESLDPTKFFITLFHYNFFCPLQPRNQWLDVMYDYVINYNHRILFQIPCVKGYRSYNNDVVISRW
jgi:hypothetical protein